MRKTYQPPKLFKSKPWGFSQIVASPPGSIIHIVGQVAWTSEEKLSANTLEEQIRTCLNNLIIAIQAVEGTENDLQHLRIYVCNLKSGDADLIAKCLKEVFGDEDPPSSTWIGVQSLAQPEYLVEIEAVAILQ